MVRKSDKIIKREILNMEFFVPLRTEVEYLSREKFDIEVLKLFIQEGDIFIDIGAHIGLYSIIMSKIVGIGGHIHAFEPDILNYTCLIKNKIYHGCKNITAYRKAVYSKNCKSKLYLSEVDSGLHRLYFKPVKNINDNYLIDVECVTLDDTLYELRNKEKLVIKADVEGAEIHVLRGARSLLNVVNKIVLLIEFNLIRLKDFGFNEKDFWKSLSETVFSEIFVVDRGEAKIHRIYSSEDLLKLSRGHSVNLLALKNFKINEVYKRRPY